MISVVGPVYNEALLIEEFHRRVTSVLQQLGDYEIVLVDDGSTDRTWEILRRLATADTHLRLIRLSRNFGHQAALSAGLDAARGDAVVLIDSDLQDPPEVIPKLIDEWRKGYDVVYGYRTSRRGETRFKVATARVFYRLLGRLAPTEIPADTGDFRLLSRRAADAVAQMPERARFLRGMVSWIGFSQTGVPYARDPRPAGRTSYSLARMWTLALDGITSFSTIPIRVVSSVGFALVIFCLGVFAWVLYVQFATSRAVPGWTSVIAVVLLLGGVQLLSLGVIGQYVARIFDESKRRPLYLVDEIVEPPDD